MKRLCRLAVICIFMLFCEMVVPASVHAAETNAQIDSRMTSISTYRTELSISSDGSASITGLVRGKTGVTSTYVKVILQKKVSGVWIDVESWEDSSNTRSTTIAETYQISRGTYRVSMTCSADGETKTATSAERTY